MVIFVYQGLLRCNFRTSKDFSILHAIMPLRIHVIISRRIEFMSSLSVLFLINP